MTDLADLLGGQPPQPIQQVICCAECLGARKLRWLGLTAGGSEWNNMSDEEQAEISNEINGIPVQMADTYVGGTAVCFMHIPINNPTSRLVVAQGGLPGMRG